ncbi:hypothetical protein L3Y34_001792 [Caenorhabditis briggsae]|uniref:Uncharacterized protein n=2 Tax=Caenorhabditis briggsae TaxID=6238 RepID=A0AAE9IQV0_CAEBR|nr:hypothetical protein L3Y34_001792 [Caenorhabditis briggsae]
MVYPKKIFELEVSARLPYDKKEEIDYFDVHEKDFFGREKDYHKKAEQERIKEIERGKRKRDRVVDGMIEENGEEEKEEEPNNDCEKDSRQNSCNFGVSDEPDSLTLNVNVLSPPLSPDVKSEEDDEKQREFKAQSIIFIMFTLFKLGLYGFCIHLTPNLLSIILFIGILHVLVLCIGFFEFYIIWFEEFPYSILEYTRLVHTMSQAKFLMVFLDGIFLQHVICPFISSRGKCILVGASWALFELFCLSAALNSWLDKKHEIDFRILTKAWRTNQGIWNVDALTKAMIAKKKADRKKRLYVPTKQELRNY